MTGARNAGEPKQSSGPEGLGYTLWRYDGAQWHIKKDCPVEGAMASLPPTVPGEFDGQLRATSCVLAS
ncbi:MAG: hypothetical protein AAGD07_00845 [Planctomycetota bacterium]